MALSFLSALSPTSSALAANPAVALKPQTDDCAELTSRLSLADDSVKTFAGADYCAGITSDPSECKTDCSKFYSVTDAGYKLCAVGTGNNCAAGDEFTCEAPPTPTGAPVIGTTYNDPHIRTLSGSSYDIHGVGVFEYASTKDVQSQVYICPVATCHEGVECMSFITSLVVKTKTHTLVASGDSVTVDGMAPEKVWEHGMNHTLSGLVADEPEAVVTSVGKHDPNAKLMRVSPKELLKPKACQPDHKSLKMNSWVWHYCSPSGWHISTPELTLRVGVVGPFEEGYLRTVTQDRSLNLAVTPSTSVDLKHVKGIINGDRNREFRDFVVGDTDKEVDEGIIAVTSETVPEDKVLFPKQLKKALDMQCGVAKAMKLKLRAAEVV